MRQYFLVKSDDYFTNIFGNICTQFLSGCVKNCHFSRTLSRSYFFPDTVYIIGDFVKTCRVSRLLYKLYICYFSCFRTEL